MSLQNIVCIFVLLVVFTLCLYRFILLRVILEEPYTLFELTPPAHHDKSSLATEQFFSVIHGLDSAYSLFTRLMRPQSVLSCEVVSTRSEGIRYMLRVPRREAIKVRRFISAYLPAVHVKKVADYMDAIPEPAYTSVAEFKQTRHFAHPLAEHDHLSQADPVGYLTSTMTKLTSGEVLALQIVLTPSHSQKAARVRKKILKGKNVSKEVGNHTVLRRLMRLLVFAFKIPFLLATTALRDSLFGSNSLVRQAIYSRSQSSVAESDMHQRMYKKLSQPLFRVAIRTIAVTNSQARTQDYIGSLRTALTTYSVPAQQSLGMRSNFPAFAKVAYRSWQIKHRMPNFWLGQSSLLSSIEVSSLYHFPHSVSSPTENVIKRHSKSLPAPISLKGSNTLEVILGDNEYHGQTTPIGLTDDERARHVFIVGGTGNGKTTLLLSAIVQDIERGKGVAVIDPHGDLAETILQTIPESRIRDVVYFNPDDLARPIGLNLLELTPGLSGDELLREKDLITESTISVMRKIFSDDDSGGHRIEYVLRNCIQTALTLENPTLFTIFQLLNDPKFRRQVVNSLADQDLQNFWKQEIGKAGEFQRVKMSAGITAKIGRFLFSASAKRILEQPRSTINFEDILDSQKILICNFSKGLLGEDTSSLFGTTVLAKIQLAALKRARLKYAKRQAFYLYVDEFQNFATVSFVQMLSEARKYQLRLTLAEQSTAQQADQKLVDIILANVGTVVCFRSGSPADERYLLPLFYPYLEQGEIANLPAYHFYMKLAGIHAQEPLSGTTRLEKIPAGDRIADKIKQLSRERYGIAQVQTEAAQASQIPTKPQTLKHNTRKDLQQV